MKQIEKEQDEKPRSAAELLDEHNRRLREQPVRVGEYERGGA